MSEMPIDLGCDAGEWYTALAAVLELHVPLTAPDAGFCRECGHVWPCATVRVVADAVYAEYPEVIPGG